MLILLSKSCIWSDSTLPDQKTDLVKIVIRVFYTINADDVLFVSKQAVCGKLISAIGTYLCSLCAVGVEKIEFTNIVSVC